MHPSTAEPDVALLRRQLERERKARRTAEQIGEQATGDLFNTVLQLRAAEGELRRHAQEQEILNVLARDLRRDLDTERILRRAVTSVGKATGADRCLVRLADGTGIGPIVEQWARPGVPLLDAAAILSTRLEELCVESTRDLAGLWIDDVDTDSRLSATEAAQVLATLGSRSYAGTPMWVGSQLVGWLVLHGVSAPIAWSRRQRVIAEGLARDLGTALLQAQAYQEKTEAVRHLEEVNQVKTDFVSTVSHELRTPLTSITGYLEVLTDETFGALTDRQRQVLDVVSRNGDRLMALIEDLLTLSRSDAGTLPVDRTEVDLVQVVAGAHRAAASLLAGRELSLEVAPVEPVAGLGGDPEQLERMLLNLLSNAVKFTPDGGRVRVTTTTTPTGVRLEVEDTGYGITEAELPHVFRRFYRTSTATERAIQGPGLGLAVVKSIVDQHGGSVDIRSTPGQGTSVTVTLPRLAAGVAPERSRALGRS